MKALIAALAFGVPSTITANKYIGAIASAKARVLGAPVYTQLDVPIDPGVEVMHTLEVPGEPPPTLRIARGAVDLAKREQVGDLWLVVAEPHVRRCVRDFKFAIRETDAELEVHVCEEVNLVPKSEWYCSDSAQARTRSRLAFWPREFVLRAMPKSVYKRIGG